MKENSTSNSGFSSVRIFLALSLCLVGVSLAVLSIAAPTSTSMTGPSQSRFAKLAPGGGSRPSGKVASVGVRAPSVFGPVVSTSVANATSPALRDLHLTAPVQAGRVEHELGPVHASRPVPSGFVDPVRQNSFAALAAPSPLITFEGQSADDSGCGCIPPDTNGAVGPTQYVQMVNSSISVYSKTGTRLSGPTRINALWSSLPGTCKDNNNGDPVVVYDQLADRWLVSQFAFPFDADNNPIAPWDECIAISKTPDATGEYYIYDFHLSDTEFQDYPHFGMWPDGYYMSTHQFVAPDFGYDGAGVWAFERDKMLAGLPAQVVYFNLGPVNLAFGGHLPANLDGYTLPPAGAPNYFVEVDDNAEIPGPGGSDAMRIWKFHVDWTTPANSTFGLSGQPNFVVPVADFSRPPCVLGLDEGNCVPQPASNTQLDPIGDRLMFRLAYRNFGDHEALVVNHTVATDATMAPQHGPRWYEVRNPGGSGGPPVIFQQGTLAPAGLTDVLHRWMGSIAMDHSGNIAIGYSTSSNTNFPSIAYAGRLANDPPPLGQLSQGETQMFAGGGSEQPFLFIGAGGLGRWGDYSDMTVDPSDDCTFWYTQEYFPTPVDPFTVWHTRIGSFKFPQCTPVVPPPGTPVLRPSGSNLVGESCSPPFNGVIDPGETVSVDLCVTNLGSANATNLVGTLAATGGVTNPGAPQSFGAVTAVGAAVCKTFTFTAANQACGSQITASLQLQDGALNLGSVSYNFTLGKAVANFSENFDGVTAPALPANWTTASTPPPPAEPAWVTTTSGPDSPPNAAYASEPATPSDKTLDSPAFLVPATGGTLSFRHKFNFDPGFDGAVLEIKVGAGPGLFTDWLAAGGTFSANGYNDTIDGTYGNPIVPPDTERAAWTNSSNGYITTTAIFPASAAGQMVQLRFRMGSDSLVGGAGWEVDEIAVNKSFTCCSGAPVSAVSHKTHGAAGFNVNLPLTGTPGIECRTGQPVSGAHKVVVTFPNSTSITSVASATCAGNTATTDISGNQVTVHCTGVPNAQTITISLVGVNDGVSVGNVSIPMGVLLGDTNADGSVNVADIGQTKSQSGHALTSSNFREDVNVDGALNVADIGLVKSKSGTALP